MTDYIRDTIARTTRNKVAKRQRTVIAKRKVYIDNYAEIPDGATLHEGPEQGLYYETEEVEEFQAEQEARTQEILAENDFDEEHVERAQEIHDEYAAKGEEHFETIMSAAEESGVEMVGGAYRIKGVGSMLNKASDNRPDSGYDHVDELNDVFGCMVKPETPEGVNEAADALMETFGEENIVKHENYMEEPQGGYYRARQFVFEMEDGQRAEVQVKTPEMSDVAFIGHSLVYKNDEAENAPDLEEEMQELVRDCLSQLSAVVVGERAEEPECDEQASAHINEMAEVVGV